MSSSYDASTSYDALDSTVYDIFDLDAYVSSLSPSISATESIPNTPTPAPRSKRYPKARGHPRPSPAIVPPPVSFISTSAVAATPSVPITVLAKPDKGKGHQHAAITTPPASPVDPSPSIPATSTELTPEQHLCFVRMLKRLDEWLARGWQPGVDESRLRTLAEIFNAAESVAEGSLSNIRRADLAWRLADSEGWEKSAGSSIMGAINIQVTVTKILFKDYGEPLMTSFRSFLGQKKAEMGSEGRPSGVSGLPLQKAVGRANLEPKLPKRVRFSELDCAFRGAAGICTERDEGCGLLADEEVARVPTYDEACRGLAQHLTFIGSTTYTEWINFLFTLRESTARANALHSRHTSCPLPDGPFAPVAADNQLRYLLVGRGRVTDAHPLRGFRCFRCDSLGHWSADHDRNRRSVYGGPPHSGVFPDSAR